MLRTCLTAAIMAGAGDAESMLESELSCPVCLSTYEEPVSLRCGHCFCRHCISQSLYHQRDEGRTFTCPMCQQQYQDFPVLMKNLQLSSILENYLAMQKKTEDIPCNDCLDLPSIAVKTCVSCEVSLCQKHVERHITKNHLLLEPTASVQERKCCEHDKLLEYYCEQDNSCICVTCYIAGSHKGHNIMTLKQAHEKQLATLSETTSAMADSVSALCKDIEDLRAGLIKITENTYQISKPLEILCDTIIVLIQEQFQNIMQAIHANEAQTKSKITAIIKQMEDAKATTEQTLKELNIMSEQPDDLLFINNFNRSQALIGQPRPQIDTMQVVGVEADKKMIEDVNKETTDYIVCIDQHLKTIYDVLSQQTEQLVWSGKQRKRVQNPKKVPQITGKKLEKMNLNFEGFSYSHCSYTIIVSDMGKTLTAKNISACNRFSAFDLKKQGQIQHIKQYPVFPSPPCNCKFPEVILKCIADGSNSSSVYCLVDVSRSNNWCVGVINNRADKRYLQWNGKCLSYDSRSSLSLGFSKIYRLKMQLDFATNVLGFYNAGHETETPLIICKCDESP
ncbi:E3 ubiquitin/ISG15 ligase TRIM25-like [Pyxicephalus adspersus]|uniref:E3 ubiquitin/ISG15 ligase TRIM25-like n=1 Tax=Pyxicephalus adspersus TaxID=30357 RepID=UPI003B5CCBD9